MAYTPVSDSQTIEEKTQSFKFLISISTLAYPPSSSMSSRSIFLDQHWGKFLYIVGFIVYRFITVQIKKLSFYHYKYTDYSYITHYVMHTIQMMNIV